MRPQDPASSPHLIYGLPRFPLTIHPNKNRTGPFAPYEAGGYQVAMKSILHMRRVHSCADSFPIVAVILNLVPYLVNMVTWQSLSD